MSERVKIALIFGAVGLVVGGGAYYFFKIHQPAARKTAAQSEVTAWEERWTKVRTCLLGEKPASGKISEALAIREMSPDPWDRGTCTSAVGQLTRGEAEDTGIPAVERAWEDLDKAAGKLAMSFITHVDPDGEQPANKYKPDPLPEALDGFQAAHAALRKAADLPPLASVGTAEPLRAATMVAVEYDGKPVLQLSQHRMTSRAGLMGTASAASGEVQIRFVTGTAPKIAAVEDRAVLAAPDMSWAARVTEEGVEIGKIDAGGELVEPKSLKVKQGVKDAGLVYLGTVIGTLDDGAVVFSYAEDVGAGVFKLVIARTKAGAVTAAKPIDMTRMVSATDAATGHTVLAWTNPKNEIQVLTLAPDKLDAAPEPLGVSGFPMRICLDRDSAWIAVEDSEYGGTTTVLDYTSGTPKQHVPAGFSLTACTVDGALLQSGDQYKRCIDDCNDFSVDSRAHAVVAMSTGWAGFRARGNVLAVKRTSRTDYFATTGSFRPLLAMTDGKQIDVIGYTIDGMAIARVPAN